MTHPRLTQEQIAEIEKRHEKYAAENTCAGIVGFGPGDGADFYQDVAALLSHLRSMTLTEDEKRRFAAIRDSIRRDNGNSIEDAYADRAWLVALFDRLTGAKP